MYLETITSGCGQNKIYTEVMLDTYLDTWPSDMIPRTLPMAGSQKPGSVSHGESIGFGFRQTWDWKLILGLASSNYQANKLLNFSEPFLTYKMEAALPTS